VMWILILATYGLSSSQLLTDMDVKLHLYIDQSFSIGKYSFVFDPCWKSVVLLDCFFSFLFWFEALCLVCMLKTVCLLLQSMTFSFCTFCLSSVLYRTAFIHVLVQNCEYCAAELVSTGSYTRSLSVTRISCCLRPGKMCTACIAC